MPHRVYESFREFGSILLLVVTAEFLGSPVLEPRLENRFRVSHAPMLLIARVKSVSCFSHLQSRCHQWGSLGEATAMLMATAMAAPLRPLPKVIGVSAERFKGR